MKIRKSVLLVGSFEFDTMDTGGQPVKSRELYYGLKKYGDDLSISYLETKHWKENPILFFLKLLRIVRHYDTIIMLPAHNGVRVFTPVLLFLKKKKTKLFYDVIGGWLPTLLSDKKHLQSMLKKIDGIWVETSSMKDDLEGKGFTNISIIRNFKTLPSLEMSDLTISSEYPLRLCTFSRVMKQKGITDAINAVCKVNRKHGRHLLSLDVYGYVSDEYKVEFDKLLVQNKDIVHYKGVAKPSDSVSIIRDYFALLFPTRFYTEGIPGTLIDAYCSGVPVVSSLWLNNKDVFIDGYTGLGYEFGNFDSLVQTLSVIAENPSFINSMKENCLKYSNRFKPENNIPEIIKYIVEK